MSGSVALQFSHIGIYVRDIDRMKSFYRDALGFFITDEGTLGEGQFLVFLSRDPKEHHQIVLVSGRTQEQPDSTVNQISFKVADLPALQIFFAQINAQAVADLQCVTHGNAWSIYFLDPEGNRIEVYTDTPWYVNQPLREPIDLEQSTEQIYRGTEALCRQLPGFQCRETWLKKMKKLMHR